MSHFFIIHNVSSMIYGDVYGIDKKCFLQLLLLGDGFQLNPLSKTNANNKFAKTSNSVYNLVKGAFANAYTFA